MTQEHRRLRRACIHEAGHALAHWYFGYDINRAVVKTVGEMRRGGWVEDGYEAAASCGGYVKAPGIGGFPFPPPPSGRITPAWVELRRSRSVARDIALIALYAGCSAEAYFNHQSFVGRVFAGGMRDMREASKLLDAWDLPPPERAAVERQIEIWTAALVRSQHGSAAIRAIAGALMQRGTLTGAEVAALCRDAYGGRACTCGAWFSHWPPTLAQLRQGYLPPSRVVDRQGNASYGGGTLPA